MIPREAMLDRKRFGEADLCQFPDKRCDKPRHSGTHFCERHIDVMRARAILEIRAEHADPAEWRDAS